MASAFAHALAAITIGNTFPRKLFSRKFWLLGALCSVLPDADVITLAFGAPYEHMLGHRGFSHSLVFALLLAVLMVLLFYREQKLFSGTGMVLVAFFFLSTVSHSLLDALTSGGLGVAFFAPFDADRYFFPWRPIQVSPIGVAKFFSERGLRVIKSEFFWVGLPCLFLLLCTWMIRFKTNRRKLAKR